MSNINNIPDTIPDNYIKDTIPNLDDSLALVTTALATTAFLELPKKKELANRNKNALVYKQKYLKAKKQYYLINK